MVDLIRLFIKAGNGGDGRISFLRTRYQMKGGPDGGNGGRGGSVIVRADRNLHSLRDYAGKSVIDAKNGQMGGRYKSSGAHSDDVILKVPVGTVVWRSQEDYAPIEPFRMYKYDDNDERQEWFLNPKRAFAQKHREEAVGQRQKLDQAEITIDPETGGVVVRSKNEGPRASKVFNTPDGEVEAICLGEVLQDGDEIVVARGGKGGRGNFEFRSSTHTTPYEAETGEGAEKGTFFFELESLADVGLVGLPNVGKSTLLSVLTAARPEIANYPFTTLEPNLGVLRFDAMEADERESYLIADIPGIIAGASEGKGLGINFLRHIERCRILVFVLGLEDHELLDHMDEPQWLGEQLTKQYEQLETELSSYEAAQQRQGDTKRIPLSQKLRLVCIGKADLVLPEVRPEVTSATPTLQAAQWLSGKTLEGVEELKVKLRQMLSA